MTFAWSAAPDALVVGPLIDAKIAADNTVESGTFGARRVLLAAGNSITNGGMASVGSAWVDLLPARVTALLGDLGAPLRVINAGVGGARTSDTLAALPALYAANNPTVVLVIPSVNDRKTNGSGLTPAVTMVNVKKQVGMALWNGATPLLATEPPLNPALNTAGGEFNWASEFDRRATNDLLRAYATANQLPLADVDAAFATNDVHDSTDGIHPGNWGHLVMANTIAEALAALPVTVYGTATLLPTLVLTDLFDRADSATTLGAAWTARAGTWGITSQKAKSVTAGVWDCVTTDTGQTNHEAITTGVGTPGAAYDVPAVVRWQAGGSHYLALLEVAADRSAQAKLYAIAAGPTPTQIAQAAIGALTDSTVLTLGAVGTALTVRVNGITLIQATDATYSAGTNVGLEMVGNAPSVETFQARKP